MNRKHVFLALALGLLLVLLCCTAALAADDPLKISMELSTNKFSEPKEITVSITVSNAGEGDLPGPVTLYYPSGKQVEEFGSPTLTVGSQKNWSGKWKVTQQELDAGKITFKIKYSVYNDEDELVNKTKTFSKRIIYSGADPELTINRTIVPTTAQNGQEVSVTYEIANTGSVDVSSVTIKENSSISSKSGTIETIPAGETEKYTFTATMGKKDLTSAATITYKAAKKTYTAKVESATVKYGQVKLSAKLTADKKGGAPGDTVKLTLKLTNSGTVDFTDVTVTDENLGTVFSNETVPKGETVTLEKDITITENQDVQFKVTAVNETGEPVETATGRLSVIATDPTQQIVLRVEASADRDVVYKIPGTVRFTVTVFNESAVDVSSITVRAVDTAVYTFDSIAAGESGSFTRDMDVSMPGSFQFTASCRDQLDQTLKFSSNIIPVSYAEPTPVPTEAPLVTPPAPATEPIPTDLNEPEWLDQVESVAGTAKWIFMGIGGVLLLLLLIGAVRRGRSRSQSKNAMDHLEGANYRDYSAVPKRGKRSEITGNEKNEDLPPKEDPPEDTAQDSGLMAETLKKLYSEPEAGAEAQAAVTEAAETAAEEAASAAAQAETAAEQAAEQVTEQAAGPEQAAGEKAEAAAAEAKNAVVGAGEAAHRRRKTNRG